MLIGLVYAGYVSFLSPRNDVRVITHLLAWTGVRHLFARREESTQMLVHEVLAELTFGEGAGAGEVPAYDMPIFEDVFPAGIDAALRSTISPDILLRDTVWHRPVSRSSRCMNCTSVSHFCYEWLLISVCWTGGL